MGQTLAQTNHALSQFAYEKPLEFREWVEKSNYIVILSVDNESQLKEITNKLIEKNIEFSQFNEADLDNQLTSIAISPVYSDEIGRMFSSLPLAGKECKKESVEFAKWLKHLDNGTTHYNPSTKKESESIGFSPWDCFSDGLKTEEELYNEFKKLN